MKKYIYKIGILAALSGLLYSCEITEIPSENITEEELAGNAEAAKAIVLGNYSQLKSEAFIKGFHYLGEYGSDNVSLSGSTTDNLMWIYNFQRLADNGHLANQWGIFNKVIVNCNRIIAKNPISDDVELNHSIAECYFMRGWIFYQLAQTFGKTYHIAGESALGTPLKLTDDINDYPDRATVKAQYVQIINDLKKAEEMMIATGIKKDAIYGNIWATKALLSRVYLTMHDYENAEKYATDVIENSGKTLIGNSTYATMNEMVPESNPEALFAVRRVKDIDIANNGWYDVGSLYATVDGSGWGEMYASEPLRELIGMYPNDVRSSFIKPQYVAGEFLEFEGKSRNYLVDDQGNEDPKIQGKYRTYYRFGDVKKEGGIYVFQKQYKKDDDGNLTIAKYAFEAIANFVMDPTDTIVHQDAEGYYVNAKQKRSFKENKDDKEFKVIYSPMVKIYGKIQKKMSRRNDYPKYFITKCSYQEKQTHLWSPMILRLSEMYLNRAEARYYRGNQSGAIEDMNVIKRRAGIPDYNAAKDGADVLKALLDERRRELYLEAQRFFDLMRNDQQLDRAYPGGHDRGAVEVVKMTIVNTDNCAIQYIPQREINSYPKTLPQND